MISCVYRNLAATENGNQKSKTLGLIWEEKKKKKSTENITITLYKSMLHVNISATSISVRLLLQYKYLREKKQKLFKVLSDQKRLSVLGRALSKYVGTDHSMFPLILT